MIFLIVFFLGRDKRCGRSAEGSMGQQSPVHAVHHRLLRRTWQHLEVPLSLSAERRR